MLIVPDEVIVEPVIDNPPVLATATYVTVPPPNVPVSTPIVIVLLFVDNNTPAPPEILKLSPGIEAEIVDPEIFIKPNELVESVPEYSSQLDQPFVP